MKLFALLIGINEYSRSSVSPIRSLQACLNDVAHVKAFLKANYSDLIKDEGQILELTNANATRQNVINGFKNHLTQASENDIVLVFYSGHGSYGITAPEFQNSTTDKQEQTWVLHDSRVANSYDLADKEIALLLEEVGRNQPHIVVISDSCNSGSVTREVEEFKQFQPRFTSGINEPRPLETYLDGAYTQRPNLTIPTTDHLLLAACERTERAWEADGEGQFTKTLLSILNKNGGQIWYSDLFVQARAVIKSSLENQTPQFEPMGSFNTRQGFLGRTVAQGSVSRYRVHFKEGKWTIDLGVGMGIDANFSGKEIEVHLFDTVSAGNLAGKATLETLNVTSSKIRIREGNLDKTVVYWGEPINLPIVPFFIYADDAAFGLLQEPFSTILESGILLDQNRASCRFKVTLENNNFLIYDLKTNVMVQGVEGATSESAIILIEVLQDLARWHRLLELKNSKSDIADTQIGFTIAVAHDGEVYNCTDSTVTVAYEGDEIPFEAIFTNKTKQKLYASLLYQSHNYGIRVIYNDTQPVESNKPLVVAENTFVLDDENEEEIDTFKLVLSTEFIDGSLFAQPEIQLGKIQKATGKGLGSLRGMSERVKSDWQTKTITIRVVRKGKQIVGQVPIKIGKGIEIQPHPSFRGNTNWAPLIPKTRSVTKLAIQNDYFANNKYCEIINFSEQSRSTEDKSILEIGDIQQKDTLKENPLVVTVQPQEGEDLMLPLFFDGEDFLPLGKTTLDEHGKLKIEITQIPDEKGEAKTRSLGSALRMVFVKFANKLGLKGETHQLRWVDYDNDAERTSDGVEEKIQNAQKVLLLIHGIIGDTEEMAKTFQLARGKGYDLVLTFDYENLNTPIEENARILKKKLTEMGFSATDKKELVLVVHSMGGLVARYMIERLGGDAFVNKLIMAGTPNGGSKFGNVPDYLNWASVALGIGAKLFPPQIGAVAGFASGILKSTNQVLLESLSQMQVNSPFIKDLAAGVPPKIPYQVIGGDLGAYLQANNGLPLMEKVVAQIGEWVYKNVKNDIAVSVDNIFAVQNPQIQTQEIPCHHLNYFVVTESVRALEKAIS